jgi:hypothetical protein
MRYTVDTRLTDEEFTARELWCRQGCRGRVWFENTQPSDSTPYGEFSQWTGFDSHEDLVLYTLTWGTGDG